jgi:outer membrane protease
MKYLTSKRAKLFGLGLLFLTAGAVPANSAEPPGDDLGAGAGPVYSPTPAPATTGNTANYALSVGTEMMAGDTTYQIGFPVVDASGVPIAGYFPFSELEWPLDVWLARIEGRATINDQWRLNATIKKDLSTPDDNMVDSDWITASNPSRLDIFSESEISSFDFFMFDADIEWTFLQRDAVSLYAGLGYMYQDIEYEAKLIRQFSPSGLTGFDFTGDGRVAITYDITYSIPYLKVGTDLKINADFTIEGSIAYSPIVNAEDTDHHLLREFGGKINSGDMDGDAIMLDVSGKYMFTPALFAEAGFTYLKIEVDGDQDQRYGLGFPLGTVTEEAESSQTSGYVSLGYNF